jgi:putative Mg2+ transporter-C (MgtC) family protein
MFAKTYRMEFKHELYIIFQILTAFFLGGFIGFERERHSIGAGIRTYAAVCMGAAMFTIIGNNLMDMQGASRMVSNIITGVGFLGAGLIFKDTQQQRAIGLTTAATIWSTAAVGVAVGYQLYSIAISCAIALYFLLALDEYKWYINWRNRIRQNKIDENEANQD